ncbi:Uncharacterised protein [Klebsiella pneumoniae]|nr:Uncharacterised protein [Klebsiella pneumoniae]
MKKIGVLLLLMASFASSAASPYDSDLSALSGQIRSLTMYVDKSNSRASMISVRQELLDIAKKLHRISEEAQSTNLSFLERGMQIDKSLNYADNISKSLDLSAVMLDSYIQTGDKNFMKFAKSQLDISRDMMSKQ